MKVLAGFGLMLVSVYLGACGMDRPDATPGSNLPALSPVITPTSPGNEGAASSNAAWQSTQTPGTGAEVNTATSSSAAGQTSANAQLGRMEVAVAMRDNLFVIDSSVITVGQLVTFRVTNEGKKQHQLSLFRIDSPDASPMLSLLQQLAASGATIPQGISLVGRTGVVAPGKADTLVIDAPVTPGYYLIASMLPDENDPDLVPQALKGMVTAFTVEGGQ